MSMRQSLTVLAALLLVVAAQAQAPAEFTPPGPNIALGKPYTLDPLPNYGDCSLDPDRKLLTDGQYTTGYFWVQKTTVGWVNKRPVAITIDLGEVQPIAGVTYNTAAGVADVAWPNQIAVLVSDDGKQWTPLGNLVVLSNKRDAPPAKPYRVHRFATDELQAHGRYVALVVDQTPYMVVDEIEVYGGKPEWLNQPLPGKQVSMSPLEYAKLSQVTECARGRLRADLDAILKAAEKLPAADRAALQAQAEKLRPEIEALDNVPEGFTTILPLNDLHARIYALNAPVLRARGYRGMAVWSAHRYDPLQPLEAPEQAPATPPVLDARMMRNERRAEVVNITNPGDEPLAVTVEVFGTGRALVTPREVIFTDTLNRIPIAAAILPPEPGRLGFVIPAGTTRQLWLDLDSRDIQAGSYRGAIKMTGGGKELTVPLTVRVASPVMPDEFSIAIGGWDETNNRGGYQVTAENMMPLIANLRDHGVNMPWSNPQVMPTPGKYDAAGNMIEPPNFAAWDEWVERWKGARCWGLFPNVQDKFDGEPMGSEMFDKKVGQWATAWVEHAAAQGIEPEQIMILLVDEPRDEAHDRRIVLWAKAIQAAQPRLTIWNDPTHREPEKALPEFYEQADVLCPNAPLFLRSGQGYRDFYVAQQQAGRELWFYSCSGPGKLLDPVSYWQGQFWLNLKYRGKGSCYWAFGDEAGDSWNAYRQSRNQYSPLFLSRTEVTDAKQMEAIREGAQDYETFMMLQARVAELEKKNAKSPLIAEAKALLLSAPEQAVSIMGDDYWQWEKPKDRGLLDKLRVQAVELLEKLGRL